MSRASSPSLVRWLLVGVPCYASWLLVNLILLALFPLYIAVELAGGRAGFRFLRRFARAFIRWFFIRHLPFLGVYRIEKSEDIGELERLGGCVLAANHTSWLDALILFSLVPDVRVLVSSRYRNVPLVRHPMRWLGCIFVDRRSRESILESVGEIRNALAGGAPVAVFPEGTRRAPGELGPFQDIFFSIAVEANAPVLPVLLHMDQPFLGPGTENFLTPRTATLRIRALNPMTPEHKERAKDLSFRVRFAMKRALAELVAPSPKGGGIDE